MTTRKTSPQRRVEIIEATLDLVSRQGPDRVSVEDVARAVGFSQAAVFRHFRRKQDLWLAVADYVHRRLAEEVWPGALAGSPPPLAGLTRLVRAHLEFIQARPAIPSLLFSWELHSDSRELRGKLQAIMIDFQGRLRDLLGQALAGPEPLVDRAAFTLVSLLAGLAVRWVLGGRGFDVVARGLEAKDIILSGLERVGSNRLGKESIGCAAS